MEKIAGNLQRIRNGQKRYAITPRIAGGFVTPEMLERFAAVAREFDAVLKITGGQRIMITNLKAEDVNAAWDRLGMAPAYTVSNRVRSVKICPGTTFCKRAKQDSVKLGMILEKTYVSQEMPSKVKIGVSGCPNSCSEAITKDFGVIGTVDGWQVYAGGSAGAHPRFADHIVDVTTEAEVLAVMAAMFKVYKALAHIERVGVFIDRIGIAAFKRAVLTDPDLVAVIGDRTDTLGESGAMATGTGLGAAAATGAGGASAVGTGSVTGASTGTGAGAVGTASATGAATGAALGAGTGSFGVKEGDQGGEAPAFKKGDPITAHTIIRDLIEVYPCTIPALQDMGMGCLGCPSSTAEPLWQAAAIHGVDVKGLVHQLEAIRQNA